MVLCKLGAMTRHTHPEATSSSRRRREAILQLLRSSKNPVSINDIATGLDMHPNTVRFHLDALQAEARVERAHATPAGAGRPRLLFSATPGMDPTGARNYRLLAEILAGELASQPDATDRATATGRAWGAQLIDDTADDQPAPERLVELLGGLGFQPTVDDDQVSLRHCPFLDLIPQHGQLLCPLHMGLMQGALEKLDSPTTVRRLEPFAQPDRCDAHLGPKP